MQFRNVTFVPSVVVTQRGPLSSKGIAEFQSRPTKRDKTYQGYREWRNSIMDYFKRCCTNAI